MNSSDDTENLSKDSSPESASGLIGNPKTFDSLLDEQDFDLFQTLIDAESRGSGLAVKLLQIFQNFDTNQAEENHIKVQSYLAEMKAEFSQITMKMNNKTLMI